MSRAGVASDPALALGSFPAMLNVGAHLPALAARAPERAAVVAPAGALGRASRPRWRSTSALELAEKSSAIAHGLADRGLAPGDRVALFVRPGPELVAIAYALFQLGAVPVLVDPGIGVRALVRCLARSAPRALVGVPRALLLRALHPRALSSISLSVAVGPHRLPGVDTLASIARPSRGAFAPHPTRAEDTAAILYTSGSTGPAKGVLCSHATFEAQIRALRALYGFSEGEVDLACFPLFGLFDVALGMTSVFPPIDPSRPGRCDPDLVLAAIDEHAPTTTFGSPAVWRRVVPRALELGRGLPSVARVLVAGAPVPLAAVEGLRRLLRDGADVHTPYGATESLPLSSISGAELCGPLARRTASGAGTCVGRAAPGVELALIAVADGPLAAAASLPRVARGELGEICARGPAVTRGYDGEPAADLASKVEAEGALWHRTGDVGWTDDDGYLWFCGRKAERLETRAGAVYPVPTEAVLERDPRVGRAALVGVGARGAQLAVLVVEGRGPRRAARGDALLAELRGRLRAERAGAFPPRLAELDAVLWREELPVDVRHNAKIRRGELARWAEAELA